MNKNPVQTADAQSAGQSAGTPDTRSVTAGARRAALATAVALALGVGASVALVERAAAAETSSALLRAPLAAPAGPPSFADVAEQVTPAVVNVTVTQRAPQRLLSPHRGLPEGSPLFEFFRQFGGVPEGFSVPREREGEGSGFLIDAEGYIVTNNHVIDSADRIEVTLNDGTKFRAEVVGRDSKTDLALLKIASDQPLPYVQLGDSRGARIGDWVLAVGNPFGLGGSVNAGIISARGRDIQSGPYDDYIQIDAPINRGNSGGPLFDARGNVIGVNTAIFSPSGGNIGIGFAIPSETVASVVNDLRTSGRVERGWLGVQIQSVNEPMAASLGLPDANGVLVADVLGDGPALAAGVRAGDVILRAGGEPMNEVRDLTRLVAAQSAGTRLELVVFRNGKTLAIPVDIGQMPVDDRVASAPAPAADNDQARIGLYLAPLTPELRAERGLDADRSGVLVAQVEAGSPAQRAGIEAGSLISMVGQQQVSTPEELAAAIREAARAERPSVLLRVERNGEQRFVAVPFG